MTGKILLIEDETRLRTNMEILLADDGYHIVTAKNGREGLQYLAQESFDLIITDIVMDDMNGFAVMEHIATHGLDTLIIVITGFASTDSAIQALRQGAYDYLPKPFDMDIMRISISRAMEKVCLERTLKSYMQELEQRVADRTKALAETNRKLQRSLTELKDTQDRLIQSEKLSALGELLSGVAHEINNPLTAILGYAELLSMTPLPLPNMHRMVANMRQEAVRCSRLVKNFLGFARKQQPEKKYVDVNALCLQTLELLAYQLKVNNVMTVKHLAEGLPHTMVDGSQLQQVLINIFNNAYQAMAEYQAKGQLTITTTYDQQKIYIRITDNGTGIPPENIHRIFDPFYTTKEKGTGLGLSISYGLIKEHGGEIAVTSELGQGTTFTIELPIISEFLSDRVKSVQALPVGVTSPKKVLIIDDEQPILNLFVHLLGSMGHQPEGVLSGHEALQKIACQDYDLIICDIKMPEMDGYQIYQSLKKNHPTYMQRLVFTSGDTMNETHRRFLDSSGCLFLPKPFLFDEFQRVFNLALLRASGEPRIPG
jgi:two-component system NtrC family sensor kinase